MNLFKKTHILLFKNYLKTEMFHPAALADRTKTNLLHVAAILAKVFPLPLPISASMSCRADPLVVPSALLCGFLL